MTLVIHGTGPIAAEKKDELVVRAIEYVQKVRAEAGNVTYSISWDVAEPSVHHLLEVWEDEAAYQAHREQAHTKEYVEFMKTAVASPATFGRYSL